MKLIHQGGHHQVWCDGAKHEHRWSDTGQKFAGGPCDCEAWAKYAKGEGPLPLKVSVKPR